MINIPIAIVLYNPTESTINRILYFLDEGFVFYIFDNSKFKNETLSNTINPNLKYYAFNKNYGLSFSLNYLCKAVMLSNSEILLFFDQDTIFKKESLLYIHNFIKAKKSSNNVFFENVLSVNFRDSESVQNKLNIIETYVDEDYLLYSVYFTINSGTLYFLDKFNSFQWFEKNYFVDGVDYSLSLNTVINKLKNIVITDVPGLNHRDEQGESLIILFGKKIYGRIYLFNRNLDFIISHLRLLVKSLKVKGYKPKVFIVKALCIYILVQLILRIKNIFIKVN